MYLALSFPRENLSRTALSGNITLNRFFSESQDLKQWGDFTTFKHQIISALEVLSSKTKEESGPFCTSAGTTFVHFKEDWGDGFKSMVL